MRTETRCRGGVAVVLALCSAGCMVYRPVPPLDDAERSELATASSRVAVERVRVVSASAPAKEDVENFTAAVRLAGATIDERTPTVTIDVLDAWNSLDEPLLGFLTLGLFPEHGRGTRQYNWRLVDEGGRELVGDATMSSPHWVGWLVGPLALLPGWRLSATWDKGSQATEAHSDARRARLALEIGRSILRLRSTKP